MMLVDRDGSLVYYRGTTAAEAAAGGGGGVDGWRDGGRDAVS